MLDIETKVLHMIRKYSIFELQLELYFLFYFILKQTLTKSRRVDLNLVLSAGSP